TTMASPGRNLDVSPNSAACSPEIGTRRSARSTSVSVLSRVANTTRPSARVTLIAPGCSTTVAFVRSGASEEATTPDRTMVARTICTSHGRARVATVAAETLTGVEVAAGEGVAVLAGVSTGVSVMGAGGTAVGNAAIVARTSASIVARTSTTGVGGEGGGAAQ